MSAGRTVTLKSLKTKAKLLNLKLVKENGVFCIYADDGAVAIFCSTDLHDINIFIIGYGYGANG